MPQQQSMLKKAFYHLLAFYGSNNAITTTRWRSATTVRTWTSLPSSMTSGSRS
jgi:hypothetical protein